MITYQVDECIDSKKFVDACNAQGLVSVWRYPQSLKSKKDPEVLTAILHSGRTLLTTDRTIHFDNSNSIPDRHAGILIFANTISPQTITVSKIMRSLEKLKSLFPSWHKISIQNSVVELGEDGVRIWRVIAGCTQEINFYGFDQKNWQNDLPASLLKIASTRLLPDV
jgi:hypothetical protein